VTLRPRSGCAGEGGVTLPRRVPSGAFILRRLRASGSSRSSGSRCWCFLFLHLIPRRSGRAPGRRRGHPRAAAGARALPRLDRSMPASRRLPRPGRRSVARSPVPPIPESKPNGDGAHRRTSSPNTIVLAAAGMAGRDRAGAPARILAAVKRGTWVDTLAAMLSLSGIAVPLDALGPLLLLWFFSISAGCRGRRRPGRWR